MVIDLESDDPDLYYKNKELAVKKKIESLKRSASRRKAKRIAGRKFFKQPYSKHANSILENTPTSDRLLRSMFNHVIWEQTRGGEQKLLTS